MFTRNFFAGRLLAGLGLLLIAALALTSCAGGGNITAEDIVSQSFNTGASPRISVETFNGRIEVTAGSGLQVAAEVTKRGAGFSQAEAQADLNNVDVSMTQQGDTIRIVARRTDNAIVTGNSGASIKLSVPPGASLDLRSSNGQITSSGVSGDVRMETSNGALNVAGATGQIVISTSNGSIDIEAQTASVDADTSNGRITFKGSLAEGNQTFRTSNGQIDISLPPDSQFRLDASTSNGRVSSDFPVTQTGSSDENVLRGTVGSNPATSITASTSNGRISILTGR